ncbi:Gag-pro-like protein [Gossypium australe]|uniref:Gag-pro-like protein n=1 Tax=Gossypium australe TaxID=47621 RepID=A0A5B6WDR0_9ROSI|nr:Gag-pro-like protein [Gossypium australe]
MQNQLQVQLQEQLAKVQQEMRDQILESERSMGKGTSVNSGDDNEDPTYPPGFTPMNVQAQPDTYPQRAPATIRPQQYQVGTSVPMNYQTGSGSNSGDNPTNPVVPDLDDVKETGKAKAELPKQLEDRCRWLEEKIRAMENADYHCRIDAKDLSLVPDLVLPPKFKTSEFEKYNGTSCPEAHITMFCRRMTRYVNNDQLLIHCFQDSLIGSAAKWYNQLIFVKQYSHVTDMTPDKITLQNMEKKQNESFRQYAQR